MGVYKDSVYKDSVYRDSVYTKKSYTVIGWVGGGAVNTCRILPSEVHT